LSQAIEIKRECSADYEIDNHVGVARRSRSSRRSHHVRRRFAPHRHAIGAPARADRSISNWVRGKPHPTFHRPRLFYFHPAPVSGWDPILNFQKFSDWFLERVVVHPFWDSGCIFFVKNYRGGFFGPIIRS
jgi:hypothetical protein